MRQLMPCNVAHVHTHVWKHMILSLTDSHAAAECCACVFSLDGAVSATGSDAVSSATNVSIPVCMRLSL